MNDFDEINEDFRNNSYDEALMDSLEKGEEDIKAGRVISFEEFKEELRIKYGFLL